MTRAGDRPLGALALALRLVVRPLLRLLRSVRRNLGRILLWLLVLLLGALVCGWEILESPSTVGLLVRHGLPRLNAAIPGEVRIGGFQGSLGSELVLDGVEILDDRGDPAIRVARLSLEWDAWDLLSMDLGVDRLRLVDPEVHLVLRGPGHGINIVRAFVPKTEGKPPAKGGAGRRSRLSLRVDDLDVTGGELRVDLVRGRPVHLSSVEIHAGFSMRDGVQDLAVRELRATPHSPMDVPELALRGDLRLDSGQLDLDDVELRWQDSTVTLAGTLGQLVSLSPDLRVGLAKLDLDDLVAFAPKLAIAGAVEGDLTLGGRLRDTLELAGSLDVDDGSSMAVRKLSIALRSDDRPRMRHSLDATLAGVSPQHLLPRLAAVPGDLSADISWQGEGVRLDDLEGTLRLDAQPFWYRQIAIGPLSLDAAIDDRVVLARRLDVGLAGGDVHGKGTVDLGLRAFDVGLDGMLADLGDLGGITEGALRAGSVGLEGAVRGTWGGDGPGPASLHARMDLDVRGLAAGPATVADSQIGFDVDVDLVRRGLPLLRGIVSLAARDVATGGRDQLGTLRVGGALQGASGRLTVSAGRGADLLLATSAFVQWAHLPDLEATAGTLKVLAGDKVIEALAPFHVERKAGALAVRDLRLDVQGGQLEANARFDPRGAEVDGDLTLRGLDLADVEGLLNVLLARSGARPIALPIAGQIKDLQVTARGSLSVPVLTLAASFRGLSYGGREPQDVDLELRGLDGQITGFLQVARLVTLSLGKLPVTLRLDGKGPAAVLAPDGVLDAKVELPRRPLADLGPIAGIHLPEILGSGTLGGEAALLGTTANPEVRLLVSASGLEAAGRVLNLSVGAQLRDGQIDLSSTKLKTDVDGTVVALRGSAALPLGELLLARLGPVEGRHVPRPPAGEGLQLGADLQNVDMALVHEIVPALRPLSGAAKGSIEVGGKLDSPEIQLSARLLGARAGRQELKPVELAAKLRAGVLEAGVQLLPKRGGMLVVEAVAPMPLSLAPFRPMAEVLGQDGLRVDVRGEGFPIPVLVAFVPEVWESSGALTVQGMVTGSLREPRPDLRLGMAGARLCYKKTGICYEDVDLDLGLAPDRLHLRDLSFLAVPQVVNPIDLARGRGPVPGQERSFTAKGTLGLDHLRPTRLDLEVGVDRMWAMYTEEIQVQLDGALSAKGEVPALVVRGDLELQNVDVDMGQEDVGRNVAPLELPPYLHVHRKDSRPGPGERAQASQEAKPDGDAPPGLAARVRQESKIDVRVALANNVRVKIAYGLGKRSPLGQAISLLGNVEPDLKLEGEVAIRMAHGKPAIEGEIRMGRGSRLTVLTRRFEVSEDSRLIFAGDVPDTQLDLEAIFPSEYGDISVLVTGRLAAPHIEFASDELEDQADMMSVLISGKPLSELGSAEGSGATAAIVEALAGFTTKVFGKFVPVDRIAVELGDDISSGSVEAGKAITPRVFFLARWRWGAAADENRVEGQLEIRVFRRGYVEFRIGDRLEGAAEFVGKRVF